MLKNLIAILLVASVSLFAQDYSAPPPTSETQYEDVSAYTSGAPAPETPVMNINEVASTGRTPVARNFQQAFNAPNSPWLTLVRNAVFGDASSIEPDNEEITAVLSQ